MKTVSEVEDRIRALLSEELDRRLQDACLRLPQNCRYNKQQPLDSRPQVDGEPNETRNRITLSAGEPVPQKIGLCMYGADSPDTWPGDLCEDAIDAKRCPFFSSLRTKEETWAKFVTQVQDVDYLRANLPGIYQLLWVLETVSVPALPWWRVLLFKLFRLRFEPPTQPLNLDRCLPPHPNPET